MCKSQFGTNASLFFKLVFDLFSLDFMSTVIKVHKLDLEKQLLSYYLLWNGFYREEEVRYNINQR